MKRRERDSRTLDLLSWAPPIAAPAFDEHRIQAATLRDRIARAVTEILADTALSRERIAKDMTAYLGEPVSKPMLDQYASQARTDQSISMVRAVGLMRATGDARHLQAALDGSDYVVIQRRYLPAIEEAVLREKIEEMESLADRARREWKAPRR